MDLLIETLDRDSFITWFVLMKKNFVGKMRVLDLKPQLDRVRKQQENVQKGKEEQYDAQDHDYPLHLLQLLIKPNIRIRNSPYKTARTYEPQGRPYPFLRDPRKHKKSTHNVDLGNPQRLKPHEPDPVLERVILLIREIMVPKRLELLRKRRQKKGDS